MKRFAALAALMAVAAFTGPGARPSPSSPVLSPNVRNSSVRPPLAFEPNVGQADRSVKFVTHAGRAVVALTSSGATLSLSGGARAVPSLGRLPNVSGVLLGMRFEGSNPSVRIVGVDRLPGVSNYYIGNDPRLWRSGVPHFAKVVYRDLYPGIDLSFYGNQSGHLEYDFTVRPGADPSVITLGMQGASGLTLGPSGDLLIDLGARTLTQPRPRIYETGNGAPRPVAGGYALDGDRVRFSISVFDHSRPLVIDPEVEYSTYLGGSTGTDSGEEFPAADDSGHVYVCGTTLSSDFPVTSGAYQTHLTGDADAFITEMNADGTGLVSSTYLGGTGFDDAVSCVLDGHGNVYVGGITGSSDFPTTPGSFQPIDPSPAGGQSGFVAKLSPDERQLLHSTYVGGSVAELLVSIRVDRTGSVFAVGDTCSPDFPTTPGAFQPSNAGGTGTVCGPTLPADHFVLKLNPAGSTPIFSTFLGGPGDDCCETGVAIDARGDAYVVGPTSSPEFPTTRGAFQQQFQGGVSDVTVSKLNPTGSRLLYSTYVGGSGDDGSDRIAVDKAGQAYVGGVTSSPDFPVTPRAFQTQYAGGDDGFITKLNSRGSALVFSTYLGGSGEENADVVIDRQGHVYSANSTTSTDFPVTVDAFQKTNQGPVWDGSITELTSDGSGLIFSTYWGGSGEDGVNGIVLDREGNLYATGCTQSTDFPTTPGAFQGTLQGGTPLPFFICTDDLATDAFVTKIAFDEGDNQAKAVLRAPRGPARPRLPDVWQWRLLLGR